MKRFYNSNRHTIQQDPIVYNDEISELFGAKPNFYKNWFILWRLMFSSCGPAQYRLNGPESIDDAVNIVKSVPCTDMMKFFAIIMFFLAIYVLWNLFEHPFLFATILFGFFIYRNYKDKIYSLNFFSHD